MSYSTCAKTNNPMFYKLYRKKTGTDNKAEL